MRLPFLIHKSSKSSENFVQLPADRDTPASATGDAEQRQSLSLSSGGNAGRSRGL
ncbi:hypothetical protein LPJ57_006897, partial [Coemansia sp. RSA 486]